MTCRRILITADAVGGVWQYATELARAIVPLGYEAVIAVLGPPASDTQRAEAGALTIVDTGLPVDWLAQDERAVIEAANGVAELTREIGAELVHLNQPALAARPMPVPTVATAHSCVATWWHAVRGSVALPADFAWQTDLVARGLAQAGAVVAPSLAFAKALQATYALGQLPHVVHNGRSPIATQSAAIHDFVLTAGRLWDEGKNAAMLDRAAARLAVPIKAAGAVEHPAGGGGSFANLHLLGSLSADELGRYLGARPVFASMATYEPFGLAVLEAAQSGCPLVLSDIPTFRELWDGAATFVQLGDDDALIAVLEELSGDVCTRLARGDLARRRAARFSPDKMGAEMAAHYRALLASGAAARAA